MFNTLGSLFTEELVIQDAEIDSIEMRRFREFQKALGVDIESPEQPDYVNDLIYAGIVSHSIHGLKPTLYGIMMFGKNPQGFRATRSFWVACSAYAGMDRASDVISSAEAKGTLFDQVERTLGWMRSLGKRERYPDLLREDLPLVPERALREAIVNAVIHRDYAIRGATILLDVFLDRIEIISPGTPPNSLTPESVLKGGRIRSRNELMANGLVIQRLMEKRDKDGS